MSNQPSTVYAPDESSDHYWGKCPQCGDNDGYLNIGRGHWFYCQEHRTRWYAGANLFDSWKGETEAEQRARYEEMDFGSYATLGDRDVCPDCGGQGYLADDPEFHCCRAERRAQYAELDPAPARSHASVAREN